MKTADFFYELPKQLIAHYPLPNRSDSKLMCLDKNSGEIRHKIFKEIITELTPNDLLVFNDTKVIPARLFGKKHSGGAIELLIERIISERRATCMIKASKAPKVNSVLYFLNGIEALVIDKNQQFYTLEFNEAILNILQQQGKIPLPPYMDRAEELNDKERYQTVYAQNYGAAAAPTAGLHFDESLFTELKSKGIKFAFITLHVGAGTFLPVRVDNILQHQMHSEFIEVSEAACNAILTTKQQGGRIIAVGTTTVRSLETAAQSGTLRPFKGETNIFIYPGFKFNCIDAMVTNFHLPESTLLMLIAAFSSREIILNAYQQAILTHYRFFSYGDAMFIY